ncbi:MAG: hypothetical protein ACFFER_02100 [Candidatus Thorarchaeota archaeon]
MIYLNKWIEEQISDYTGVMIYPPPTLHPVIFLGFIIPMAVAALSAITLQKGNMKRQENIVKASGTSLYELMRNASLCFETT